MFVFCIYYLKERSTNHAYALHTYTFYQIKLFIVFIWDANSVPIKLNHAHLVFVGMIWQTVEDEWGPTEVEYLIICAVIHLVVTIWWIERMDAYLGIFFLIKAV